MLTSSMTTRAALLSACALSLVPLAARAQTPEAPPAPESTEVVPVEGQALAEPTTIEAAPIPTLDSARELYFTAQFESAHTEFKAITTSPTVTRDELVEALRYLVTLELMLGRPTEATGCARALLALAPDATLPDGSPDNAIATFERLRGSTRASEIELTLTDTQASATLTPPIGVLPTLRISCTGGTPATLEGRAAMPLQVALDPQVVASCDAEALSSGGAPILTAHAERAAIELVVEEPPPVVAHPEGGEDILPWIAIGAGSVAAVAIVITIVAVVATQDNASTALPAPAVVGW